MRHALVVTSLIAALALSAGGAASADIRARISAFHDHANGGRFDAIRRDYKPVQTDFDTYMRRRSELGRMIRTTEAKTETASGHFRVVMVHHNTEFERGHALELFSFSIDDAGTRLASYSYQVGKKLWCPTITVSPTNARSRRHLRLQLHAPRDRKREWGAASFDRPSPREIPRDGCLREKGAKGARQVYPACTTIIALQTDESKA
jgi:hypothetical protein